MVSNNLYKKAKIRTKYVEEKKRDKAGQSIFGWTASTEKSKQNSRGQILEIQVLSLYKSRILRHQQEEPHI